MTAPELGPTGEICFDLPSPYQPHPCGLLHLPRFIAKCRKHLAGELPKSYQKNFCRGFDRFLSMHLGVDPKDVLKAVETAGDDELELDRLLADIFPEELKVVEWKKEEPTVGLLSSVAVARWLGVDLSQNTALEALQQRLFLDGLISVWHGAG